MCYNPIVSMSKKNKLRVQKEHSTKKREEAMLRRTVRIPRDPNNDDVNGINVVEQQRPDAVHVDEKDMPADLSNHTFNWKGEEDSPIFAPNLIRSGNISSVDPNLRKALEEGITISKETGITFINHIAKSEVVPDELEREVLKSPMYSSMVIEGIRRWHDLRSRNGSLGKERG